MSKRSITYDDKSRKKLKLDTSHTLYVSNLNDKIHSDILKTNLYLLSSCYGDVVDIVIKPKSRKMRGQAHIVFSSVDESKLALLGMNSFELFDKPMKVDFARRKSNIIRRIEEEE